jgi:DNA-binding NarL/FixJ family response regulator
VSSATDPSVPADVPVPVSSKTTVLLADDHHLFREGLRRTVEATEEMAVVGQASDGEEAIRLTRELRPRVVLVELNMPVIDGIRVTEAITSSCPHTNVVLLTMYWQDDYAAQAVRAGARGYLLKTAREEDVLRAVRLAATGGSALDPSLASAHRREYDRMLRHGPEGRGRGQVLNRREIDLLRSLVAGKSNRQIAVDLGLAESTIKNNLSALFHKIGVRDRTQAVLFAFSAGLVPQPSDDAR